MKLFGSTRSKITKNKNSENVTRLEITEVVLKHNVVNKVTNKIQESCIHLFLINCWINYSIFHLKFLYF